MKYLCESCSRLVDLGRFSIRSGTLVLTCPACGAESRVEGPPGPAVGGAEPPGASTTTAPEPSREPPALPAPGGPEPRPSTAEAAGATLPPEVEAGWTALLARWQEASAHAQFVALAGARGVLAEVGRRYRARVESGDAMAVKGRDEVIRKAIELAQMATPAEERASRGAGATLFITVGLLVVAIAILALTFRLLR